MSSSPYGATALLAEDDEMIREILTAYLEALGYHVLQACDGQAAIDLLRLAGPRGIDLLVTDLIMPKAGGDKVVQAARESDACRRCLIISGCARQSYPASIALNERLAYLEKPFNFEAFEASVGKLEQSSD